MVPQQQYGAREYKKYSDLISYLLVAEKNNKMLMKNHQLYLVGILPLLEANVIIDDHDNHGRG